MFVYDNCSIRYSVQTTRQPGPTLRRETKREQVYCEIIYNVPFCCHSTSTKCVSSRIQLITITNTHMYQPQNQRKHSQNIRFTQAIICVCVRGARLQRSARAQCACVCGSTGVHRMVIYNTLQNRQQTRRARIVFDSIERLELWLFCKMFMLTMPMPQFTCILLVFSWIPSRSRRKKQRNKFLFASLCTLFCVWFHSSLRHIGVNGSQFKTPSNMIHRNEILTVKSFLRGAIKMEPFHRNIVRLNDQHSVDQTFSFPFSMDAIDVCDEK